MKNPRFLCLIMAILAIVTFVGCNSSDVPAETTGSSAAITDAPEESGNVTVEETEPAETEPAETEPPFEIYEGPGADFKFTLENVLGDISYTAYRDFLAKAEKSFLVPALAGKMIPQGMDIWEERGWLLISGYFPSTDILDSSILVAIDMNTGAYVGEYYLTNTDGTPHSSHAGGVAVTEKNIF